MHPKGATISGESKTKKSSIGKNWRVSILLSESLELFRQVKDRLPIQHIKTVPRQDDLALAYHLFFVGIVLPSPIVKCCRKAQNLFL